MFDEASGEICVTSLSQDQGCNLSQLIFYNISITDITENLIFENNNMPESHCVTIDTPQCGPFLVSAYPYDVNNSVVYSSVSRKVILGMFVFTFMDLLK